MEISQNFVAFSEYMNFTKSLFYTAQLHWTIANSAHVAARSKLGADHPIRRVLKPFLYNTGSINMNSALVLAPENGFLHRVSGFTYNGLTSALSVLYENYSYETLPDIIASKQLSDELEKQIPMCIDGRLIWDAFFRFFKRYVDFFYSDDNAVAINAELRDFWECVDLKGEFGSKKLYGLPKLTKTTLAEYLSHLAFNVTACHELNGNAIPYSISPKGGAMKIRADSNKADVQSYVQGLILIGLTGNPEPLLMENWAHLLPNYPEVTRLYIDLKHDLYEIMDRVDEANAIVPSPSRPRICQSFNPKYMACSVSA